MNTRRISLDELPAHSWDIDGVLVTGEDILNALSMWGRLQEMIEEAAEEGEAPGLYEDWAYSIACELAPAIAEREAFAMRRGRRHLLY